MEKNLDEKNALLLKSNPGETIVQKLIELQARDSEKMRTDFWVN